MNAHEPTTSVIICAYTEERWSAIVAAVASVQCQTFAATEIFVVIDHNPALLARSAAAFPDVRVIANTGPSGLSGARNSGIAAASGEFIAFSGR